MIVTLRVRLEADGRTVRSVAGGRRGAQARRHVLPRHGRQRGTRRETDGKTGGPVARDLPQAGANGRKSCFTSTPGTCSTNDSLPSFCGDRRRRHRCRRPGRRPSWRSTSPAGASRPLAHRGDEFLRRRRGNRQVRGADIASVVSLDLGNSGLFEPLDPNAFLQRPESLAAAPRPRFGDWRRIAADALVTGRVEIGADFGAQRRIPPVGTCSPKSTWWASGCAPPRDKWRRVAHLIADEVYRRITGEEGYFDTRIVYVAETGPADARVKRLAIMDQDGANARFITDGAHLVLTPALLADPPGDRLSLLYRQPSLGIPAQPRHPGARKFSATSPATCPSPRASRPTATAW